MVVLSWERYRNAEGNLHKKWVPEARQWQREPTEEYFWRIPEKWFPSLWGLSFKKWWEGLKVDLPNRTLSKKIFT